MTSGLDLVVTVGAYDQQSLEPAVTDDEVEELDGRGVGPLEVLEHHDHRSAHARR